MRTASFRPGRAALTTRCIALGLLTTTAAITAACDGSSTPGGEAGTSGSDEGPRVIFPLEELTFVEATDDPFADHRPETVTCSEVGGWYSEGDGIEIDTARCNYFAAWEGAVTSARGGELLELTLSHFDLTAPEPAEAHVALRVDGELLYEEFIAIPGSGAVYEVSLPLHRDVPRGAPLEIHLHNHGQNSWNVGPVTVRSAD